MGKAIDCVRSNEPKMLESTPSWISPLIMLDCEATTKLGATRRLKPYTKPIALAPPMPLKIPPPALKTPYIVPRAVILYSHEA